MPETIGMLLTSSVIAALCTGIFLVINSRRENRIRYVTGEKDEWRKEIKAIADELMTANGIYEIRSVLNKLKVRINPYGRGKKRDFVHDSHIWELIKVMEEKPYENQIENKEKLILYISLLLKYDYEKTGLEVNGDAIRSLFILCPIVGIAYVVYIHFFKCGDVYNDAFICACLVLVFFPMLVGIMHPIKDMVNIIKTEKRLRSKFADMIKSILKDVIIFSWIAVSLNSTRKYYNITWKYLHTPQGFMEGTIVLFVMGILFMLAKVQDTAGIEKVYEEAVGQIYNEDKNLMESNTEK